MLMENVTIVIKIILEGNGVNQLCDPLGVHVDNDETDDIVVQLFFLDI